MKLILKYTFLIVGLLVVVVALGLAILVFGNRHQAAITVAQAGPAAAQKRAGLTGLAIALYLQARAGEINRALSADPTPIPFTIEPGESPPSIAERLQGSGLIRDPRLFRLFLRYNDLDTSLEAGNYELRGDMTMKEIGLALQKAQVEEVEVTIPEGWRAEQIAERLSDKDIMDGENFLAVVHQGTAVSSPLLVDRPPEGSYEGYLFPDTYRLPVEATPEDLITAMLENLANKLPADVFSLAERQGLTFYEVLTLAAIVEREAVLSAERPIIASVYLNRLSPDSPRPYLEADPTVQYAMGYQSETDQWWKTPVSLEEYAAVDSLYNTYLYPGLPPGPIANPGLASIMAVLQPAEADYFFFVCRRPRCEGGEHVFAKTYEEHLENVAIYYGSE